MKFLLQLKVFDVLGNEIATLVNEFKPSGFYEVIFNAADLSSGIYFYQIKIGDYLEKNNNFSKMRYVKINRGIYLFL